MTILYFIIWALMIAPVFLGTAATFTKFGWEGGLDEPWATPGPFLASLLWPVLLPAIPVILLIVFPFVGATKISHKLAEREPRLSRAERKELAAVQEAKLKGIQQAERDAHIAKLEREAGIR